MLRDLVLETPPNAGGGLLELLKGAGSRARMLKLPLEDQRLVVDLFTKSASDFLAQWFENETVKAAFAFDGIVGSYAAPSTPGTAYVLLHHCFGEVNGKPRRLGPCASAAWAPSRRRWRRRLSRAAPRSAPSAEVREVLVEKRRGAGRACSPRARIIRARAVAANIAAEAPVPRHGAGAAP